jgi:tetratricopeptide (TPR) repeat protein
MERPTTRAFWNDPQTFRRALHVLIIWELIFINLIVYGLFAFALLRWDHGDGMSSGDGSSSTTGPALVDRQDVEYLLELSREYQSNGDWLASISTLERAQEVAPDMPEVNTELADAYLGYSQVMMEKDRWDAVIKYADMAAELQPQDDSVLQFQGLARTYGDGLKAYHQGNWDMAISRWEELQSSQPGYPRVSSRLHLAWLYKGWEAQGAGDLETAKKHFTSALGVMPESGQAHRALAQVEELMAAQRVKRVEVSLDTQTLIAYEGDTPVFQAVISSGMPRYPTVEGEFNIYAKHRFAPMTGGSAAGGDYYYLPNVPSVMYFYSGFGLHGTYWHSNFGTPMSHGCVNLTKEDALWLFNWTDPAVPEGRNSAYSSADAPGTLVVIRR